MGLSLTVGILLGLALLSLPEVLSPPTQSQTTLSHGGVTFGSDMTQPGSFGNPPNRSSIGSTLDQILILVSMVLFPAVALSFLARYWTLSRARERFRQNN
jgi:hypothetical protein